ncbi:unnamed protein product [Owenia fusiformis]|uniref:Transcription elongation factor n=1 Tax=Owenia fusiformis TaxID=6347 RepID=A0A8J1YAI2_OWEFU|nr:unnamed protein product [Owenia fusiformis]
MSCEEDVIKIRKKLEKLIEDNASEHGSAYDLLKTLKKLPMTLEVLQKTRVGMTVNNFRKTCSDENVISLAKSLIKNWKKLLPEQNKNKEKDKETKEKESTSDTNEDSRDGDQNQQDVEEETPTTTSLPRANDTGDEIRLKCREMLTNALKGAEGDGAVENPVGTPEDIAAAIEDTIYTELMNTGMKYKSRVRSRVSNLRDKKNPELRKHVLSGRIAAEKLAVMTSEEMANEEMQKLRAKYTKESIDDHQMSVSGGTTTDLLKCGKCGKRNCTYNQVQTRSADEPMTTFVLCNNCGNRWKFC